MGKCCQKKDVDANKEEDEEDTTSKVEYLNVRCLLGTLPVKFEGPSWQFCGNGEFPENAVIGGWEGQVSLIARGRADGALIPGAYYPEQRLAIITNLTRVYEVKTYDVLVAEPETLAWIPSEDGKLVNNAVIGGQSASGELLYIGRKHHDDSIVPGKVSWLFRAIFVAWELAECEYERYELLIRVPRGSPLPENGKWAKTNLKKADLMTLISIEDQGDGETIKTDGSIRSSSMSKPNKMKEKEKDVKKQQQDVNENIKADIKKEAEAVKGTEKEKNGR